MCDNSTDAMYDSTGAEPILPSLLPFSLSLNGQQYETNDADWTEELGYIMYAATIYNISTLGADCWWYACHNHGAARCTSCSSFCERAKALGMFCIVRVAGAALQIC